jgi:hypothetical protein
MAGSGSGGPGRSRIPELEVIEFKGATSVAEYSRRLRSLGRDLAAEVSSAAEELEAVLSRQKGHPLLFGVDVRRRARRVARYLARAAELSAGVATEAVRFHYEFRVQFAEVLSPPRDRKPDFDFTDET